MSRDYHYDPSTDQTPRTGTEMQVRDAGTGELEIIKSHAHDPGEIPLALRDSTFLKIATKPVNKTQQKILTAPVDPLKEIDILPTGEVYMSHVHVRRRLNSAFGGMGWALRPLAKISVDPTSNVMYREYALIALGRVVATAFGSTKYQPTNARMDFADAAEGVKSNALTRCAKDLLIGSECWDRRFCEKWIDEHAVHVAVMDRRERKLYWRRIDSKPFYNEYEVLADSPNQDKWRQHFTAWLAAKEADRKASKAVSDEVKKYVLGEDEPKRPAPPQPQQQARSNANPVPSEARKPAEQPAQPVQHGAHTVTDSDRGLIIKECRILQKGKKQNNQPYAWHGVTMMDGTLYTTFSTTTYAEMQKIFAARQRVQIDFEVKEHNGRRYNQITEWKVLS